MHTHRRVGIYIACRSGAALHYDGCEGRSMGVGAMGPWPGNFFRAPRWCLAVRVMRWGLQDWSRGAGWMHVGVAIQ